MKTQEVTVLNEAGLHARPAAVFVQTAQKFAAKISISANEKTANAKSLLSILGLGVVQGTVIRIQAEGDDEEAAVSALAATAAAHAGD